MRLGLLAVLLAASAAQAQVTIDKPWLRATAPGAKVGGGYLTIRNPGAAPERLVGASSPAAARVELHVNIKEGEMVKMRQVRAFDVPAQGSFELKPGGAHLMFIELRQPFKEGEKVPVTLKFEKTGELRTEFHVGRLGGGSAPAEHKR